MKRFAVLCLGLAILTGCSDDTTDGLDVKMPANISQEDRAMVVKAINILLPNCRHLLAYADQLTNVKASLLPESVAAGYGFDKSRGWKRIVQLEATVKHDATTPRKWGAQGQVLAWQIGGGTKPGVHIVKAEAARFCDIVGGDVTTQSKVFEFVK